MTRFNLVWHRAGKPISHYSSRNSGDPGQPRGLLPGGEVVLSTPTDLTVTRQGYDSSRGYKVFQAAVGFSAIYGALDNHNELSRRLKIITDPSALAGDAELLWVLYSNLGKDAFGCLKGKFSLVVADFARECVHLFRSPLLGRSLFYFQSRDWFVADSQPSGVLRHTAVSAELSDEWLAHYFDFRTPPNAMTPFRSVSELLPGELLTVSRESFEVVRHPPGIGSQRVRYSDEREYEVRFDELVSKAVANHVSGRKKTGIMLSGGLDSVPAAYWMQRHRETETELAAYSWSLCKFPEADESALIMQSAERIGIPLHLIDGDDLWPLNRPEKLPICPDTPQQNAFRPLKQAVYRMAADHGCRFLFSGHFGDLLYPEYHHVLADALYSGNTRRFVHELQLLAKSVGLRGLCRQNSVKQIAKKGLGWRGRQRVPDNALTPFANGLVEWGQRWPPEAFDHPRPDHYRSLLGVEAARGHDGEGFFSDLYGMDLVEPYADWDLVDFVLSAPSYIFWNCDETKVLMRRAMNGRIPESVRTRPRGGLLTTFFFFGVDKRINWIKQRLFSGVVDWPRFADRRKIRAILDSGEPGEKESMLLLQCVSYEMWLDRFFR